MEVLIEFSDLRDGVEFLRVIIPAFDEKLEGAHHRRERDAREGGESGTGIGEYSRFEPLMTSGSKCTSALKTLI